MTENPERRAIRAIIAANADFRSNLPEDWEGDPLQDAIDAAAKLLELAKPDPCPHCGEDQNKPWSRTGKVGKHDGYCGVC